MRELVHKAHEQHVQLNLRLPLSSEDHHGAQHIVGAHYTVQL